MAPKQKTNPFRLPRSRPLRAPLPTIICMRSDVTSLLEIGLTPQIGSVSQIGLFRLDGPFERKDTGGRGYRCMVLLVANLPELW